MKNKILEQIVLEIPKSQIETRAGLDCFKRRMSKKYKISCPKNVDLLKIYHKLLKNKRIQYSDVGRQNIERLLRTRPVRSLSGIVNVSVLMKPYPCPGKCIFCPTVKDLPKSYLKSEPAVQRAILNRFNPYLQVQTRLRALQQIGHPIDKIELRIIGGTWNYYPKTYQTWFVKECFYACNEFSKKKRGSHPRAGLGQLQKANEKAKCHIIGITIETRPDYINIKKIKRMRELGVTRVELGAQSVYDDVLKLNKRGHKVAATIKATRLLKDAGFKVSYQMMPDLPGSTYKKDVAMFKELFETPGFKPDLLKIYPLALVKETPLYKWYKQRKYKPYSEKKLFALLLEIKKYIPYWCRVERIIRDFPSISILEGGAKVSNLRQRVQKEMTRQGLKCKCIRCREVGRAYNPKEKLYLFRQDYEASQGKEIFLTFENKKRQCLYALLRLRVPLQLPEARPRAALPALKNAALIREVHTYGQMTPIYRSSTPIDWIVSPQHKGLGRKLIKEAEKIAKKEFNLKKIAAISGVGVRGYYRTKLGYRLKDTYMIKKLTNSF